LVFMSATSLSSLSVLPRVLRPFPPLPPLSGENEWLLSLPRLSVLWNKQKAFVFSRTTHSTIVAEQEKISGKRYYVKHHIFIPEFARSRIGGKVAYSRTPDSKYTWNILFVFVIPVPAFDLNSSGWHAGILQVYITYGMSLEYSKILRVSIVYSSLEYCRKVKRNRKKVLFLSGVLHHDIWKTPVSPGVSLLLQFLRAPP